VEVEMPNAETVLATIVERGNAGDEVHPHSRHAYGSPREYITIKSQFVAVSDSTGAPLIRHNLKRNSGLFWWSTKRDARDNIYTSFRSRMGMQYFGQLTPALQYSRPPYYQGYN
jgi:hypothetical protein